MMLIWLLIGIIVTQVAVFLPSILLVSQIGVGKYLGSRDEIPEPSVFRARALRAATNTLENMPIFFVLGVLSMIVETSNMQLAIQGAMLFIAMRIAYIASYVLAIPVVRSTLWTFGWVGLVMMFVSLL
jgi:uncharacterized MAPEG superfamily protein